MNDHSSNEDLLYAYKDLDPKGFDLFYKRNHTLIFNFLLSKLGNRADAEEALQETFFKIHKAILTYDSKQNALGWTFTIARNAAIDIQRKKYSRQIADLETAMPAVSSRTEEVIMARESLTHFMKDLSSQDREILMRRFIDEESYEEIANHFEIKEEGVRQKVSRLLKKLKGPSY